jgi:hypothetical protein
MRRRMAGAVASATLLLLVAAGAQAADKLCEFTRMNCPC